MAKVYSKIVAVSTDFAGDFSFPELRKCLPSGTRITALYNFATATQFAADIKAAMKRSDVIVVDTSDHTLRFLRVLDLPYQLIYASYCVTDTEQRHITNCRRQANCIHTELKARGDYKRLVFDFREDLGLSVELPSA
jgi:hypothetical protein